MTSVTNEIFNINKSLRIDESIESLRFVEYEPSNTSAYNESTDITIDVSAQDNFVLPCKSYLLIEGVLKTAADAVYDAKANVSLVNNAIAFMFSKVTYLLNGSEVESISDPGQATTMRGILMYDENYNSSTGMSLGWVRDMGDGTAKEANTGHVLRNNLTINKAKGHFSFVMPLAHLFGFCTDYKQVLYGCKHTMKLSRAGNNNAILRGAASATDGAPFKVGEAGKIIINKLMWYMPHVSPSLEVKTALMEMIASKIKIDIPYRALYCESTEVPSGKSSHDWRITTQSGNVAPRWLVIGFQTARENNQEKNNAIFDHLQATKVFVTLNSDEYPGNATTQDYDFGTYRISRAYKDFRDFKSQYIGDSYLTGSTSINMTEYTELYPLFVIDLRYQAERLKNNIRDITVHFKCAANIPASTRIYGLVISDRLFTIRSDGNRFQTII